MTLDERIREDLDHQEACGWHHDWPEALAALRAVLDLPGMRETMAQALGVTS